jgi:hypothetical protein
LAMTVGSPPSRTETTELVVPRSIPTARDMLSLLLPGGFASGCRSAPWRSARPCWPATEVGVSRLEP